MRCRLMFVLRDKTRDVLACLPAFTSTRASVRELRRRKEL